MKKTLSILGNIVLVILIFIGVFVVVPLLPIKNNYKIYAVKSGSMQPTIKTGALVVVRPVSEYKENDIISFYDPDSNSKNDVITHRINKIENTDGAKSYVTKGDANEGADNKRITEDRIVGKEFINVGYIGYFFGYIKTLPGLLIIIIVPATVIIYEETRKIKDETKRIVAERRAKKVAKTKSKSDPDVRSTKKAKSNKGGRNE